MPILELSSAERSAHRSDAHALKPIVLIGADGLTPAVIKEVSNGLNFHGLIKVRVLGDDRQAREAMFVALADQLNAAPIQHIGKLFVLWRPRAEKERTVDENRLLSLRSIGFNRISFGVQDFNRLVQKAVHRIQPAEQVFALVESARSIGFDSINVDLIYGLPKQTPDSFDRTLAQVAQLRPDRIALYAYAHLPDRFKPQRRIIWADLPMASSKVAMLSRSLEAFSSAGYVYVGMDHFALPTDALAVAHINAQRHGLSDRIQWRAVAGLTTPLGQYDLILCNPPYVNAASMDALPAEYRAEPELALASGEDGMDFIRQLLADAPRCLTPEGVLVLEIGNEREHFERAFPHLDAVWLPVSAGDDQVLLLTREALTA